ncbi:hypothetical protein [Phenylobacterium montanum]|uniref:Transporter n=1 Tax=Phenylobacterium montanum TaxID=2823693 RepID=A0A975G1J5_9CAUL|nr:hypothetical protein [Caulobacter sp. S6]QUD88867.1 hypothetical protein KCG34_02975 [Caulobacter sp. S6]
MHSKYAAATAALLALSLVPAMAQACACGCDQFDVGGPDMNPAGRGGEAFLEYDYADQSQNWSGDRSAPASQNADKEIRTHFVTAGLKSKLSQDWGVLVEAPIWSRTFRTETDAGTGVDRFSDTALGDMRVVATYTGLSKDQSSGLIVGLKLATGDWKHAGFDRDTEIGTGSTNLLLGGFHSGMLSRDGAWGYYARVLWDKPLAGQGGYLPGQEVTAAAGVSYDMPRFMTAPVHVIPLLQVLASTHARDGGRAANPADTGYTRMLLSPGIELTTDKWGLYADVEVPLYQHVNGNQLTAPVLAKLRASRRF